MNIERGWHVQIWDTEWVFWGYGPNAPPMHIAPAEVVITTPLRDGSVHETRIPFEFPQVRQESEWSREHPPEEVERRRGWGWRFKSNSLIHDTGWHVADSREEALEQAMTSIEKGDFGIRKDERPEWLEYAKDVREIKPTGSALGDIINTA